jgi:hypothetical protein
MLLSRDGALIFTDDVHGAVGRSAIEDQMLDARAILVDHRFDGLS